MGPTARAARRLALPLALAALCTGAAAQESDPIGALLANPPAPPVEAPAAETVSTAPQLDPPPQPEPPVAAARPSPATTPPPAPPRVADRTAPTIAANPVFLDERDRLGSGLNAEERSYEARMRASYESAQGLQGPLDGSWALVTSAGVELYALRFVDRGSGELEGAWRDTRRPGALDGSGFLDDVDRQGTQVTLRFSPRRGAPPSVATLSATGDGAWSGQLIEDSVPRSVVLRRR